jgi:hypothetical protein
MVAPVFAQCLWICWFALQISEVAEDYMHTLGWVCFFGFVAIVTFARVQVREIYKVWGSPADDATAALVGYPFALAQLEMMITTDGKDAPLYWEDVDECIKEMDALAATGPRAVKSEIPPAELAAVQVSQA